MASQNQEIAYRENFAEAKTIDQRNLLVELHVRLRSMDLRPSTLETVCDLTQMVEQIYTSSELRHNLNFGRFESAALMLVEEGLQKTIHSFQLQLMQPWRNLHNLDAHELRHRVPDTTLYSEDYRDMFACSTDISQFEDVDLHATEFEPVKHMLKALDRRAGRLSTVLTGDSARSLGSDVAKWFFEYAVWLTCRICAAISVLFRGWEVRLLNQTVPGTGETATEERFIVKSKVPVVRMGRLQGWGKKIDALGKHGTAKVRALRDKFRKGS